MNLLRVLSLQDDRGELLGPELQVFRDHADLSERMSKSFYYGKLPTTDRPSLALTGIAVEMFSKVLPNDGLELLDMHYAASVTRRACITPCSLMLAVVYLDQLRHRNPEYLASVSPCELFLVSMLVASKFLYDDGQEDEVFNGEWAASAGMDLRDLNLLERRFLDALDWNLYVKPETFTHVLEGMEHRIAYLEFCRRGWSTYTDISALSKGATLGHCWLLVYDGVIKVMVVSAIAYVAATLTLFGSATLVHKLASQPPVAVETNSSVAPVECPPPCWAGCGAAPLQQAHQQPYQWAQQRAHDQEYQQEYQNILQQKYQQADQQGYQKAHHQTWQAHQQTYQHTHQQTYQQPYQQTYQQPYQHRHQHSHQHLLGLTF